MPRSLSVVASFALGLATVALTRDADALDAVDIEVGAKVGWATNPVYEPGFPHPPNPLGFGLGGRAGLAFKGGLYLGGSVMYYPSGSEIGVAPCVGPLSCGTPTTPAHTLMYGAEMGYGIKLLDLLTIRPQLGFGDATLHPSLGGEPNTLVTTMWYLEPGVTGLVGLGPLFVGADVNMLLLPYSEPQPQGAFSFHAQVGVKY